MSRSLSREDARQLIRPDSARSRTASTYQNKHCREPACRLAPDCWGNDGSSTASAIVKYPAGSADVTLGTLESCEIASSRLTCGLNSTSTSESRSLVAESALAIAWFQRFRAPYSIHADGADLIQHGVDVSERVLCVTAPDDATSASAWLYTGARH